MRATAAWVKAKVDEWNLRCFGGALPPLPVQITQARSYCGQIAYRRQRVGFGKELYSDFRLRISVAYDYDEQIIIDTIIHELIHYEILYKGLKDTSSHGTLFRRRMNEINRRYNRHITITEKLTKEQLATDQRRTHHLLCIIKFADGRYGITRAARTCLFRIWDNIHTLPGVKDRVWIWSTDPYFNRYPRSQKVSAYRIESDELLLHLDDARLLQRSGDTIRVAGEFDSSRWFLEG